MYCKKEAVPHVGPFEVCYFLSLTFCFFCTRLTSVEMYFIRAVFKLLHKIPSTMSKVEFLLLLYLFFSIPQTLFSPFIFLIVSEPKRHWVILFLIKLKHQMRASSAISAVLETAYHKLVPFWIPVKLQDTVLQGSL